MSDWIVGYVGDKIENSGVGIGNTRPRRTLTDWHGKQIGTCFLSSSWPINSYIGLRMYQIYAKVNGVDYTGRGFGKGMSVNLRPCAKPKSKRR